MSRASSGTSLRDIFGARRSSHGQTFVALDGLRGLAVLLVLAGHLSRAGVVIHPAVTFADYGLFGVYLFFVLSSFLLTTPLLAASAAELGSSRQWSTYALRRILRIYPLYTVVLIAGMSTPFVKVALFGPRDDVSVTGHLLLREGAKIMWAIPVEMKFYVLLPFLAVAAAMALRSGAVAAAALAAAVVVFSVAFVPDVEGLSGRIALSPNLAYFACGFAAAVAFRLWRPRTSVSRAAVGAAGWLALAWCVANTLGHAKGELTFLHLPLRLALGWGLLTYAAIDGGLGLSALFRLLPLRLVGIVSFSVYLWHMPILEWVRRIDGLADPAKAALTLVLVLAAAMLSYLVIEFPFIEYGRRLSRTPGTPRAQSGTGR